MAIPVVLIVFLAISTLFTPPCTADSVLYPGDRLLEGESITTAHYELKMEDHCDLVLYNNQKGSHSRKWHSDTAGKGSGCYATLLGYGKLGIKDNKDNIVWNTTATQPKVKSSVLILQRDGNVTVYSGPVWFKPVDKSGTKALGRKMGIGNGGDDIHRAFVLVNSEGETELGSMITQVVNE